MDEIAIVGWHEKDLELVEWFRAVRDRFPQSSFWLWPWCHVSDPNRFFAALDLDVVSGPNGPRARRGALQDDLRRLRELFGELPRGADGRKKLPVGSEGAAL
ncbi:MAG TPA: hypothetical protein VMR25_04655 [Planctomycetaceae bacterium]|jgi:hypothetical protein|nr:hypothetical protein [Planctomycetaceae bacterium]